VARPENPIDPHAGPLAEFAEGLRRLRKLADLNVRELAQRAHVSASALSQAASGQQLPTWEVTAAFVQACGGDLGSWRTRWDTIAAETGTELRRRRVATARREPSQDAPSAPGGRPVDDDAPPLDSIVSPQDFHQALKSQRVRAGNPSLRELSATAGRIGRVLPRSTLAEALAPTDRLPPVDLVEAFLSACGVPAAQLDAWRSAWARTAYHTQREPAARNTRWSHTCPYRGLAAFGPDEAEVFYGRERATGALLAGVAECLTGPGMLIVTGASGAGKSSLLRAGLLPALAKGTLGPGSQDWPHAQMTPGTMPLGQLAVALATLSGTNVPTARQFLAEPENARLLAQQILVATDTTAAQPPTSNPAALPGRLVLIVDQFEEVFTACPDPAQRDAFIAALCAMAGAGPTTRSAPAIVLLSVRGDFFGHCAASAPLAEVLQTGTFVVGPLTESELRSTITGPAAAAGLLIEDGLVDNILADLRSAKTAGGFEPAVLPLLSHAMLLTWRHREGDVLTHRAYAATGGLASSVSASAEATFADLTPGQQSAARMTLRRMITIPSDGVATRRRVRLAELDGTSPPEDVSAALAAFTTSRLIVVSSDTAEIAHDIVLHTWPRLQSWLESDRAQIALVTQLTDAARAWEESARDPAFLYRSSRLAAVLDDLNEPALPTTVRAFLEASKEREAQAARASQRRRQVRAALIACLAVMAILSSYTAYVAFRQREEAERQRLLAVSGRVAFASQTLSDDSLSGLLAVAAWRIAPNDEARNSMITALAPDGAVIPAAAFTSQSGAVNDVAFSPDGQTLATAGDDGAVVLWDLTDRAHPRQTAVPAHTGAVNDLAFSPDGQSLATTGRDNKVLLWNIADRPPGMAATLTDSIGAVYGLTFSPDGRSLATAGRDSTVRLWNIADPTQPRIAATLTGDTGAVYGLAFSPDGRILAAGGDDATAVLWDLSDRGHPRQTATILGDTRAIYGLAFSPDGRSLATAGRDSTVLLWNIADPTRPGMVATLTGHTGAVYGVAFSPDGRILATAGDDNTVRLWNVATRRPVGQPLVGSTGGIRHVAFSPGGRGLVTSGNDGRVQLWSIPNKLAPEQLIEAICDKAGRDLTPVEWTSYVPGLPYRQVCPSAQR
jgi:Tol biopolymer transport system component/transcriptional regulator with XRE-family HTH domain